MHELGKQMKSAILSAQINKQVNILWEKGQRRGELNHYMGYTPNFLKVETTTPAHILLENTITQIRLKQVLEEKQILIGE